MRRDGLLNEKLEDLSTRIDGFRVLILHNDLWVAERMLVKILNALKGRKIYFVIYSNTKQVRLDAINIIKYYQIPSSLGFIGFGVTSPQAPFRAHPHAPHLSIFNHLLTRFLTATESLSNFTPHFSHFTVLFSVCLSLLPHSGQIEEVSFGFT